MGDPQTWQNECFGPAVNKSCPVTHRKSPNATLMVADEPAPEHFRHFEQ
jgi:hypothetical protein